MEALCAMDDLCCLISPSPKSGDVVNFTVMVRNAYLTKKDVEVKLFIDGNFVDSTEGSIPATSDMTFTLHWLAESGQHSYEVKLYMIDERGEELVDMRGGSLEVSGSSNTSGLNNLSASVRIESLECTPREVGLYEWRFDRDKVVCTVDVDNTGSKVQIAPRVVVDGIEAFWLNTRILSANSSLVIRYEVKFSDALARLIYGPSATALSFVRTVEERGNTTCQRHVCYTPIITHYLPEDHTIGLRIYKAMNYMPTTEMLAQSKDAVVTVKYDGYVEKEYAKLIAYESMFATTSLAGTGFAIVFFGDLATTTI